MSIGDRFLVCAAALGALLWCGCDGGPGVPTGPCDEVLRTGLVAEQTGISADAHDCDLVTRAAEHGEPDPMIFKAIIYVESRFDASAAACPNLPCGMPDGWTAEESGCYGLLQVVLSCGGDIVKPALLPDGHPNLTTDMSSPDWAGSIFNPAINIAIGIAGFADNRAQVEEAFPGCTEEQYTLMAMGNYNSYGSTKSCTEYNKEYDDLVLEAYKEYAAAAGYPARPY
jgi:soluble lytic murein transglycosylase-like protein